jgi:hypothetical protein
VGMWRPEEHASESVVECKTCFLSMEPRLKASGWKLAGDTAGPASGQEHLRKRLPTALDSVDCRLRGGWRPEDCPNPFPREEPDGTRNPLHSHESRQCCHDPITIRSELELSYSHHHDDNDGNHRITRAPWKMATVRMTLGGHTATLPGRVWLGISVAMQTALASHMASVKPLAITFHVHCMHQPIHQYGPPLVAHRPIVR